jgi:hypothetical protein
LFPDTDFECDSESDVIRFATMIMMPTYQKMEEIKRLSAQQWNSTKTINTS